MAECSAFIPRTKVTDGNLANCPKYNAATCAECKAAHHIGDCEGDAGMEQVRQMAREMDGKPAILASASLSWVLDATI